MTKLNEIFSVSSVNRYNMYNTSRYTNLQQGYSDFSILHIQMNMMIIGFRLVKIH